ncbi:MAG TPA: hypothetical protein OQH54_02515 [Nitrosopumilus sp.]|nr:hypothetical protein [Thermoproteota archaeon]HJJ22575.1 hypothetical protein [Nitrosopumilus sp.]
MTKKRSACLILIFLFSSIVVFDASAHSMFNSSEKFEAGYRVQVATLPEFPQIDEPSQFLVRVTEGLDYNEVNRFTMGIRVFYNDQQIDTIPATHIEGSHWDIDYVWKNPGNHIVKVDLYNIGENQGITTYTFNMGTQNPFGIIFFSSIIIGVCCLTVVVAYIYLPKKLKKFKL